MKAMLTYFLSHAKLTLPVENSLQRNGAHPIGEQEHQVLGPVTTKFGVESAIKMRGLSDSSAKQVIRGVGSLPAHVPETVI